MQVPVPPTIPSSVNTDSSYARTLQVSSLQVDGQVTGSMTIPTLTVQDEVSFFGADLLGQQTVYPTLNSILQALQRFGLAAPGYFEEAGPLIGSGATGAALQGSAIALSEDGNTLAIGGYADNSYIGAVWIFVKTNGVWTQQGSKLVGTGATGNARQGSSVALSADGNTLAIGGVVDNSSIGATWIFVRSGTSWSQQGSKLVGNDYVGSQIEQGTSVSLSSDGNTLAVGGYLDGDNTEGATWIYVRSGSSWSQQGSKLVGTTVYTYVGQGICVSLSSDGNTLAVGGWYDGDNSEGATWVFVRSGTSWSQQGPKLVGTGYVGSDIMQGYSVALRGNTLVVGGPGDENFDGATWVFTRSGTTWTQKGNKLVGTGYVGDYTEQGYGVAISSDETTFITAAPYDNTNIGAIWVFKLVDDTWTQFQDKLVGTGYTAPVKFGENGYYGSATGLSGDGNTIAFGGCFNNSFIGGAWVFTG